MAQYIASARYEELLGIETHARNNLMSRGEVHGCENNRESRNVGLRIITYKAHVPLHGRKHVIFHIFEYSQELCDKLLCSSKLKPTTTNKETAT